MGGRETAKGILYQSLICVLDLFDNNNDWISVSIEPDPEAEKVDIRWEDINQSIKVVQVKSSKNSIGLSFAESWATQLEDDIIADSYELILIGPARVKLTKTKKIGKVELRIKNLDIDSLENDAVIGLETYLEKRKIPPLVSKIKKAIIKGLTTDFTKFSTQGELISKIQFEKILNDYINPHIPQEIEVYIEDDLKNNIQKLYCILFETDSSKINRAELITLIDTIIGEKKIAIILNLRYKKKYSESTGEVISLYNENWRLNCRSGLESGHGLNSLNIYTADKRIYTYGKENQDESILEDFRSYFVDQCSKSGIIVDYSKSAEQITELYREFERKNQRRRRTVF